MRRRSSKARTAAEVAAELKRDPEYIRQVQARDEDARALAERLSAQEQVLVRELAQVGIMVDSVWDLVNSRRNYTSAISILLRHLSVPYHPQTREGIARALTIPNLTLDAGKAVVRELRSSVRDGEQEFRWALANALSRVADPAIREEVEMLIAEDQFESIRSILRLVLKELEGNVPQKVRGKGRNRGQV